MATRVINKKAAEIAEEYMKAVKAAKTTKEKELAYMEYAAKMAGLIEQA